MEVQLFREVTSADDAHALYRALAFTWHPDRYAGPDATDMMVLVNTQYKECLTRLQSEAEDRAPADGEAHAPGTSGSRGTRGEHSTDSAPSKSKRARQRRSVQRPKTEQPRKHKTRPAAAPNTDMDRILHKGTDLLHDALGVALRRSVQRLREWLTE